MSEFGLLAIFVTIQLALTAYKSKSGLGRIQRFFFKSIGVETVDGSRLKEDATVEDKVFPIRGNSTCLDKGRLRTKQNSAGKLPGKEILSDKSLNPQALATVRKILRDFFAECEQLLLLPASRRFRSPAQPPGMMIIKQNKSSTSHTPYKMVTIVSNRSVKHSEAADRVKKFCKSKMIHCSALTEGKFVKHANFI